MNCFQYFSVLCLSVSLLKPSHAGADNIIIGKDKIEKHITLMKLDPGRLKKMDDSLLLEAEKNYALGIFHFVNSDRSVDLGMVRVPVLDQGRYGTCVTFAATAALDAKLGIGDFISQQCSLALNMQAGENYWNGAYYPSQIIDPLKAHGVIEKSKCPSRYPDNSQLINAQAYEALADKKASAAVANVNYEYFDKSDLFSLKNALKAGHRVLIGFMIDGSSQEAVQGFNVKVDGVQNVGGGWFCKQGSSANHCVSSNSGHEVVIIGYDDKQQLLKIRNSWADQVGDDGDYYMSYTFFNSMVIDMTVVK